MRRKSLLPVFLLAVFLLWLASGCSTPHDDNIEVTSSIDVAPVFLEDFTQVTQDLYAKVGDHEQILRKLNCYCGCMDDNDPHDSLYRCFIVSKDLEGVHWTDHGATCGVCLLELRDVVKLTGEGKTFEQIKEHIETTYNQ
jgi:hypothetical protein